MVTEVRANTNNPTTPGHSERSGRQITLEMRCKDVGPRSLLLHLGVQWLALLCRRDVQLTADCCVRFISIAKSQPFLRAPQLVHET